MDPIEKPINTDQPPTNTAPDQNVNPGTPANPAQAVNSSISPSFKPAQVPDPSDSINPTPVDPLNPQNQPAELPRGKFIKGYNFKFTFVIVLVGIGLFGIFYYRTHPLPNFVSAATDSIKSGLFKTSVTQTTVPGSTNSSSQYTQTTSATTTQNTYQNSQLVDQSSTTNTTYSTSSIVPGQSETVATSCLKEGEMVFDSTKGITYGVCCEGLRPLFPSNEGASTGATEVSQLGVSTFCRKI